LDLGNTPYKNMKYHEKSIRQVRFSHKYPLMASASDDGNDSIYNFNKNQSFLLPPPFKYLFIKILNLIKQAVSTYSMLKSTRIPSKTLLSSPSRFSKDTQFTMT